MRVFKSLSVLVGVAASAWSAPQAAVVSADTIAVHSKALAGSPARGSLQRGDTVVINMVVQTGRGAWCDVTKPRDGARAGLSGYVECSQLEQQAVDEIYRKASATPSDADTAIAEALRLSGFTEQATGLGAAIDGSVTRAITGDRLTPQQQAAIATSVKRAITPEKLTAAVSARLKAEYSPDTLATVIRAFQLPNTRKITQLEVHEDLQSAGDSAAQAFGAQLSKSPPSRVRQMLIDRILQASGSSGVIVEILTGTLRGMMSGLGASPEQVEVEVTRALNGLPPEVRNSMLERISLLYSYRSASDAELAQYADVLDSPALHWFYVAVKQGYLDFAQQSGAEIVKNLGIKAPSR